MTDDYATYATFGSGHWECDCVPNLGPSHCHGCGEVAGHPVPWIERTCENASPAGES